MAQPRTRPLSSNGRSAVKAAQATPGEGVTATGASWRKRLRYARKTLHLSQQALADLCQLSHETVRGYENGRRRPKRESLTAVLSALGLEHAERRRIMEDAGFAADPYVDEELMARIAHTAESAVAECERHAWPAFVTNEFAEVVGANSVAQRLWGIDLDHEGSNSVERNLLSVVSDARFADHLKNWDEVLMILLSVFKGHDWAPDNTERPGPYLAAVLDRFLAGDKRYVGRLIEIWQRAPITWERKEHWSYPIVWQGAGPGLMRFEAIVTSASLIDGLTINDWIPLDGRTWRKLGALSPVPERRDTKPRISGRSSRA